jgi:hypothetical protein
MVVVTVSHGFHEMFDNWWYHYKQLKLTMKVKMITEDALTFDRYKSTWELQVVRGDFTLRTTNALNYRTREYKKLVSKRATYLLKEINYGRNIIYTDIDTVWLKDPRLYLKGGFDVWAPLYHWYRYCTGFVALRATSAVEYFLIEWENMLQQPSLNQYVFSTPIKRSKLNHICLLEQEFPSTSNCLCSCCT